MYGCEGRMWRQRHVLTRLKAHIGVDVESDLVHTVVGTAANVSDVTQAHALLHGEESVVFADAGYLGMEKREQNRKTPVTWYLAMKCGERKALPKTEEGEALEAMEQAKASTRAKVEHPFHGLKNLFLHRKTRYRGLAKNVAHLMALFGRGNLMRAQTIA